MSMNSAEITRAGPELVQQFEILRSEPAPAVGEIKKSDAGSGDVSDETQSGLFRLVEFIKLEKAKPKHHDRRRQRAIQAYDSIKNFKDQMRPGQVLHVAT